MMSSALLELPPAAIPDPQAVMERAGGENFPVAARVLSRRDRHHLLAIYGFARLVDELGDEIAGDRLGALDWLERELESAYAGRAQHPLMRRLQESLRDCELPRELFLRLIEANRMDQEVKRFQTWEQLRDYCVLSANPVGELVLRVFGLFSAERVALSDRVCTALQLVEHSQDVREDLMRGRIYLPEEDLVRFGCDHDELLLWASSAGLSVDLDRGGHGPPYGRSSGMPQGLRETIEFEMVRARGLLDAGVPLVASIPGRPKLAVAAFVGGGRAALEEVERARCDVLEGVPRASRSRRLRALAHVLAESRA